MRKVKPIIILLFVTFSLVTLTSSVTAQSYDFTVEGQNNPEQDIKAIQEAVDKGGAILLRGIFDFGNKGRVNIKKDVKLVGEMDNNKNPITKIKRGFWSFHSPLPSKESPPESPGPKITIQGIHFDGAMWTPIFLAYTSDADISNNKITNVIPFEIKRKWQGGDSFWWQAGAVLGTQFINWKKTPFAGAVTGKLVFQKNNVDLQTDKPKVTLGQGVYYQLTWGADIEVRENVFTNVSRNSIETLDNYLDKEGVGRVTIANNKIITPIEGCPFPGPTSYPNGIVTGWFHDMSGGMDPSRNSKILILDNYVETSAEFANGIISLGNDPVILNNQIVMKGGAKSKGIKQIGSNAYIANNKIEGSGEWAMQALTYKILKGNGNTFAWNDTENFKAFSSDYLCVGNNNTMLGKTSKVVDKGKGNMVLK